MMYGFNQQISIDKINQQIAELERMKNGFQTIPQPITNVINTGNSQNIDFEARILNENEKPNEILIQRKTAFIDLKNGKLSIKEMNGDIKEYELVLPKTADQLKIEELERKLKEYEYELNKPNVKGKFNTNDAKHDKG